MTALKCDIDALITSDEVFGRKLQEKTRVQASESAGKQQVQNLDTKQGFGREEGDDIEGLILNADYHGVTTHPSPLPKHPRP
ncbi:uncharacterized protein A4U43_C05F24270 [Asparagus officinalis]|uniref:Uncharacterized protein n=1 Tax=Asparagus officinalis TaxID=4686 RepID=A0A5P1EYJ7_ASPOF|nr:uncharacterized protein A4U43_C05F24270 [Asparagus officinalis]